MHPLFVDDVHGSSEQSGPAITRIWEGDRKDVGRIDHKGLAFRIDREGLGMQT